MLRRCTFLVFLQLLTELWRGPCSKVVLRGQERPSLSLGAAPQAKTQEEFDDWLELAGSTDPQITAGLAEGFVLRYPHSEFDGRAYQMQMMAHARLDHYEPALAAGRNALQLAPNDLHVLAMLANIMANGVAPGHLSDPRLEESLNYARKILQRLSTEKIPPSLPLTEWRDLKLRLEVSARAALGLVMLRRGQTADAIRELEWVTRHDPEKEGVAFLRLGLAYVDAREYCAAARAFERASALGPNLIRERVAAARKGVSACPGSSDRSQ